MNYAGIHHLAYDRDCYVWDSDKLVINIRTGKEIEKVTCVQGDPFQAGILGGKELWTGEPIDPLEQKELPDEMLWSFEVQPPFRRLRYYFIVETKTEKKCFLEDGFYEVEEVQAGNGQCFVFPWMNEADEIKVPSWVKHTRWYQIFPERFARGSKKLPKPHLKEWTQAEPVENHDFYGGDLYGIVEKLEYLTDLGVNGIYLTPIMESPSTHKYDTTNYQKIDDSFGGEEAFHHLVEEAHKRKIRVMVDGVFNHCGAHFAPWEDVVKKGKESPYYDWFMLKQWPIAPGTGAAKRGEYYSFAFADNMPKLNTNNKEVQEYFLKIVESWVREYHVDGIRLDVANELSHDFCKQLRRVVKEANPDCYLLGEIWHNATPWLRGDEFDSVMNYPFMSSIGQFFYQEKTTQRQLEQQLNRCNFMYPRQTGEVMFNLLDSHDTDRLRNRCTSDGMYLQQLVLLYTMPGSPCVFYGTEIAMEGAHDPDCRRCMPWEKIEAFAYKKMSDQVKKLLTIRREEEAAISEFVEFDQRTKDTRLVIYKKKCSNGALRIILNQTGKPQKVDAVGELLFQNEAAAKGGKILLEEDGCVIEKIK